MANWDEELPVEAAALRNVPFFEGLTPEDLDRLARIGRKRKFAAGESMVVEGQIGGGLFIILSGSASLHAGGKTHTLGRGQFFGEMALLAGKPRSATVTAAEPVEAMTLETMYFRPFLIKNPSVAVTILEVVADRLREVQERVDREQGSIDTEA
jgi:CRP-like cAMP-binding protein